MNKIIHSFANQLQFFNENLVRDERYLSKDFEDFEFPETILPWEQQAGYCQPFQLNDTIADQLQTNLGPVNFVLKDCRTGKVIDTVQYDQKQESLNEPGLFIYELSMPLLNYNPGVYYGEIQFGGIVTLRTGELSFEEVQENTLLLEYGHYESREDLIFETGFFGNIRVEGTNRFIKPKQKATVYEDQVLNMTALRSQKYRLWKLVIGGSTGIPDYMADKIGAIIGCSDFRVDGKNFTTETEAELEPNGIDGVALRGWSIDLRERYTKGSRIFEDDTPIDGQVAVMVNVDSKGFGNSQTGSQTAIKDVI